MTRYSIFYFASVCLKNSEWAEYLNKIQVIPIGLSWSMLDVIFIWQSVVILLNVCFRTPLRVPSNKLLTYLACSNRKTSLAQFHSKLNLKPCYYLYKSA